MKTEEQIRAEILHLEIIKNAKTEIVERGLTENKEYKKHIKDLEKWIKRLNWVLEG